MISVVELSSSRFIVWYTISVEAFPKPVLTTALAPGLHRLLHPAKSSKMKDLTRPRHTDAIRCCQYTNYVYLIISNYTPIMVGQCWWNPGIRIVSHANDVRHVSPSPLCLAPSCIGERQPKKPWSHMVVVNPNISQQLEQFRPSGLKCYHNLVTNNILLHHGVKTQRMKWAVFRVLTFGMRGGVVLRTCKIGRRCKRRWGDKSAAMHCKQNG